MTKRNVFTLMRKLRRPAALVLICLYPGSVFAGTPVIPGYYGAVPLAAPKSGTLPQQLADPVGATIVSDAARNQLTVLQNQGQDRVTIDWKSFNLAPDASVRFQQGTGTPTAGWQPRTAVTGPAGEKVWTPDRNYVVLNRIYDASPSQIFGNIQADGKVYLVNRNGILFGPGSTVNVHSLAASALNMTQDAFTKGLLQFTAAPDANQSGRISDDAIVGNFGEITTDSGGSVYLVGPVAANGGTINAPVGKVKIVGIRDSGDGSLSQTYDVDLTKTTTSDIELRYGNNASYGLAANGEGGVLSAESGRVEMSGGTVRQNGIVRAVSAVRQGGSIYLTARDLVATGRDSVTESPVSDSKEKVDQSFTFAGGTIQIGGVATASAGNVPLAAIDHKGRITAPRGSIELLATDRVFLDTGSSIDVSGLWVDQPASAYLLDVQLNSVELRDDYGQKDGILKGEEISTDLLSGSSIGNLSGSYLAASKTARERSTGGGTIAVGPAAGGVLDEIIVKDGASLSFAGGGYLYGSGSAVNTRLVAGNTAYAVNKAPQWISYDRIAGTQQKVYDRFGITKTFTGFYYGGGTAVADYMPARLVGSDAGTLKLQSRVMAIDGTLDGSVTIGRYQNSVTRYSSVDDSDPAYLAYKVSVARGLERPRGGGLELGIKVGSEIGGISDITSDLNLGELFIAPTVAPLDREFSFIDPLDRARTELSAELLNRAGLGTLGIYSNTAVATAPGAQLSLLAGGSFTAKARRIVHEGEIDVPAGTVELSLRPNLTSLEIVPGESSTANPLYTPVQETVYLAGTSRISVAGEVIDNRQPGNILQNGRIGDGTAKILIQDRTMTGVYGGYKNAVSGHRIVVAAGAELNADAGYRLEAGGKVAGGDAGIIELKAPTLSLAGNIHGLSLAGRKGGEIRLHAGEVVVGTTGSDLPDDLPIDGTVPDANLGRLLLADDRFRDSGFAKISLTAIDSLSLEAGTLLAPSHAKLATPVNLNGSSMTLVNVDDTAVGSNGVTLAAGANIFTGVDATGSSFDANSEASVTLPAGATVQAAPGGSIAITGPVVDVGGTMAAQGGAISVKATGGSGIGRLTLGSDAVVTAAGYNRPTTGLVAGLPAGSEPRSGGTVRLEAALGDLTLSAGSLVDVSGSAPVERLGQSRDRQLFSYVTAGDPGSLTLVYGGTVDLSGTLDARGTVEGVKGGSLEVRNAVGDLTLDAAAIDRYRGDGFDALTFASTLGAIDVPLLNATVGRSLTLDAATIRGTAGSGETLLQAPWIRLVNTGENRAADPAGMAAGTGSLRLAANSLDLEGSLLVDGFRQVSLEAERDIRVKDLTYTPQRSVWDGRLGVAGDLTLIAGRIYPTTAAEFTMTTAGKTTILPGADRNSSAVSSAGGSLTIAASGGIEHQGLLAAPLGRITLDGKDNRVYLGGTAEIVTGGEKDVHYGSFDGSTWTIRDAGIMGSVKGPEVAAAPEKKITLTGRDVIVSEGASIEMQGGGKVFTDQWQAGIEGSVNPLTKGGRFVVLPDRSVTLPGEAVYLEAVPALGLSAGVYSVLPAEYAFTPGALVIDGIGSVVASGDLARMPQGYPLVAGYRTVLDTGLRPAAMTGFTVRRATEVLKEGNFTHKEFAGNDSGTFTLKANASALLAGSITASPLADSLRGTLDLSAGVIDVRTDLDPLPEGFTFDTPLPPGLDGVMQVKDSLVSGAGNLILGAPASTTAVTVRSGSTLQADSISLNAANSVTVEGGASVLAVGAADGSGIVAVNRSIDADEQLPRPPAVGEFSIADQGVVRSAHAIRLNAHDIELQGELQAENSSLSVITDTVAIVPDSYRKPEGTTGLFLNEAEWRDVAGYEDLELISRSDFRLLRDLDMAQSGYPVPTRLTIDAAAITGETDVTLAARDSIRLLNSGGNAASAPTAIGGSLTLKSGEIAVTPNKKTVVIDRFSAVNLESSRDTVMKGEGTLQTAGDLTVTAVRLTTSSYRDAATPYQAADFTIKAGGDVTVEKPFLPAGSAAAESDVTPGGSLAIEGESIITSGTIEVASGQVKLTATGAGGIAVTDRYVEVVLPDGTVRQEKVSAGQILARGSRQETAASTATNKEYAYSSGGDIILQGGAGGITLKGGTLLDVSAADQGSDQQVATDSGTITLTARESGVTIAEGTLAGAANAGRGGSLSLDATNVNLTALAGELETGGFTDRVFVRAREGNLTLDAGKTLSAREIVLAADGLKKEGNGWVKDGTAGALSVAGTIAAVDCSNGGRVELYGQKDLTVTGTVEAKGATTGGEIVLGSAGGRVMLSDGLLDVSGASGGAVHLRALREGTGGVKMTLAGEIRGADRIDLEANKVYEKTGNYTVTSADIATWNTEAADYLSATATAGLKGALLAGVQTGEAATHLRPGIEVQSSGDMTLPASIREPAGATVGSWDLTTVRPGGEAGVLTLRAGGNLNVNANLVDHPTGQAALTSTAIDGKASWVFNLAAGADLNGASPLATVAAAANRDLTVAGGKAVYTENAPLRFAAANNLNLGNGAALKYMINDTIPYSLATYGGDIRGEVGNNLTISNGAIQSALGDIDLRIGGKLDLKSGSTMGAIRTTGEYAFGTTVLKGPELDPLTEGATRQAALTDYWSYRNGGSISLAVAGSVAGDTDAQTAWDGVYGESKQVTLDGRPTTVNKFLAASFDGTNSTRGIATMGGGDIRIRTGGSFNSQVGTFGRGTGSLSIAAGNDLKGRFRVTDGGAFLSSGGNFGAITGSDSWTRDWQVIELSRGNVVVTAQGDMGIGTILNPDNTRSNLFPGLKKWNMTYDPMTDAIHGTASSVSLTSLAGDLAFYGTSGYTNYNASGNLGKLRIFLPPTVAMTASGNIRLRENFALAPAATGNLRLIAGKDLSVDRTSLTINAVAMTDLLPSQVYGFQTGKIGPIALSDFFFTNIHFGVVHPDSPQAEPVTIRAANDLNDLRLLTNKKAEINAGRDIVRLDFIGQNTGSSDLTSVTAGRDLSLGFQVNGDKSELNAPFPGILLGGPGYLLVQAGQGIDLGNSRGIKTMGSNVNTALTGGDSTTMVLSGAKELLDTAEMASAIASGNATVIEEFFLGTAGAAAKVMPLQPAGVIIGGNIDDATNVPTVDSADAVIEAGLLAAGERYSGLKNDGETADAEKYLDTIRAELIAPLFAAPDANNGEGGITMIDSQISGGSGKLFVLARSDINVGRSTFKVSSEQSEGTGITTNAGGNIYVYAGRDVNVNESRVMTYMGGDIMVWSDRGDINAGRGSKSILNASPPVFDPATQTLKFVPPAAGSGLRAVTFDPDGLEGPRPAPDPGDITLVAPNGKIDAGEAGIVGGKIILAAPVVVNTKNISASAGSVGVPASSAGSLGIGALSGAGAVTDSSRMIEQTSGTGAARDSVRTTTQVVDDFMSRFLDIKVINFDMESIEQKDEKEKE